MFSWKQQLNKSGFSHVIVQSTQQSVWVFCNDAYWAAGCSFCLSSHTFTAQAGAQIGGKHFSSLIATLPLLCKSSTLFSLFRFGSFLNYYPPLISTIITVDVIFYVLIDPLVCMNFSLKCLLLCLLHTKSYSIALFLPLICSSNWRAVVMAEVPRTELHSSGNMKELMDHDGSTEDRQQEQQTLMASLVNCVII